MRARDVITSLKTAGFDRQYAFYSALLGKALEEKAGAWAAFDLPAGTLMLWHQAGYTSAAGALQLCLVVEDLERAIVEVGDLTPVSSIQVASHGREAFFCDRDGNEIILYEKTTPVFRGV